eukprot:65990_1
MAHQQIALQIAGGDGEANHGPKLTTEDLIELGLDEDATHVALEFDHAATVSYALCLTYASVHVLAPLFCLCYPCLRYAVSTSAESRKGAVTERQLVLKQGAYGCCCCCWNEMTKSVSLEKITDLSISQGCLQRCFNIKSLSVENASSSAGAPEMILNGLIDPEGTRKLVLRTRDNNGFGGRQANRNVPKDTAHGGRGYRNNNNNNYNNPLLVNNVGANNFAKQNYDVNVQQAEALTD